MYAGYFKLTIVCASLTFVAGFISLTALYITRVWPAKKGLSVREKACQVMKSEIFCDREENVNGVPCIKVYVLCGDDVNEQVITRNFSNDAQEKQRGVLLRKDVYHLDDKCSFETHSNICSSGIPSTQDLETHFLQRARPGTVGKCYCDTEDPDVVVSENRDRDHYNSVVLQCVLWPVALIILSILALTAAVCFCTNRTEYRRIP